MSIDRQAGSSQQSGHFAAARVIAGHYDLVVAGAASPALARAGLPLGASGTRLMTTMLHHMQSARIRYGPQTMCEGGGQANATILELL